MPEEARFYRDLYRALLLPRMIEEKMLLLLRQGRISKWFSGIGQEAIAVGATSALLPEDFILPLHRNLGVFTTRGIPLVKLFAQFQGKAEGFTRGRDRSFHFGAPEFRIVGMISHLGAQLGVADGIALAEKLGESGRIVMAFSGDGGTSEGDFHEALNLAAVWDLPVIFLIENNGYGLSTPVSEQYRCKHLADRAAGYGMEGCVIDGNNVLEVYNTVKNYADDIRKHPRPVLIECKTFRMRGHEEASGVKYVPAELFESWKGKDPIKVYRDYLLKEELCGQEFFDRVSSEIKAVIDHAVEQAFSLPDPEVDTLQELKDVYPGAFPAPARKLRAETKEMRFVDAVSDGLREAMRRYPNLILMGQDIAEYGGVFKVTEGFLDEFGRDRVRNTPLCESAVLGAALGLSVKGYKSMVEMQFSDFVSCGFNQIVNNIAKVHYRWGQPADVVVRMPCGAGVAAGPFHSQSDEAWFCHVPGLTVIYPATPADARGLLLASFEYSGPVLFFEHKALYRSIRGEVPIEYVTAEIGRAGVVSEGSDATIITWGAGVHWARKVAEAHPEISLYILDLRTLVPPDKEAIRAAVAASGRVLVLHEATLTAGFGAEVAAIISEEFFQMLDAPVMRCASLDTPVPFHPALERNFLAESRLESTI
ncbi:MAG: dehydrogenase, partial [Candidatus Dadabacteria bacterium]